MRKSRLPAGSANVLQRIRQKRTEAEAEGRKLLDISIGEPKGPALLSARRAAGEAVMSDAEVMHAYQYNASPAVPEFSERFVQAHLRQSLADQDVDYVPISGIKPVLGLLPLACGCANNAVRVATMTQPGYPIPADWCDYHPHAEHYALPLNADNEFRFRVADIQPGTDLIMLNYPHNPSGQVSSQDWLRELCRHCAEHDIRIFNDAAYVCLSYADDSWTLADVAIEFPDLSWAEAYTAAKLIGNGTGWHVGALVGSPDFVADIKEVKGKTDAGFVAAMAAGALVAFEEDQAGIAAFKEMYRARVDVLVDLMSDCGMQLALKPQAGFFTLWKAPTRAFGEAMESAEIFNFKMIDTVGVVGVHFPGYMRYAVCADVAAMAPELTAAFQEAAVGYG